MSSPVLALDRAPRLRRRAQLLEDQADRSHDPERARELAREMRVRAAELESGNEGSNELAHATALIQAFGSVAPPRVATRQARRRPHAAQ